MKIFRSSFFLILLLSLVLSDCAHVKSNTGTQASEAKDIAAESNSNAGRTGIEALKKLEQNPSLKGFVEWERDYAQSPYYSYVRMKHEAFAWRQTLLSDTDEGYESFIREFPKSQNIPKAKTICLHKKFNAAQNSGTADAYENLVPLSDDPWISLVVTSRLMTEKFQEAELAGNAEEYRSFCLQYPQKSNPLSCQARERYFSLILNSNKPEVVVEISARFPESFRKEEFQQGAEKVNPEDEQQIRDIFSQSSRLKSLAHIIYLARRLASPDNPNILEMEKERIQLREILLGKKEPENKVSQMALPSLQSFAETLAQVLEFYELELKLQESIRDREEWESAKSTIFTPLRQDSAIMKAEADACGVNLSDYQEFADKMANQEKTVENGIRDMSQYESQLRSKVEQAFFELLDLWFVDVWKS